MPGKVKKQGNIIYLNAYGRWYQYDETQPPLGAGAMGVVYVGEECQTHEPVAVKRVVDHYANNPEIRRRAHQEADLMFSHPNLVEMLGCCEVRPDTGPIFIISRFVKGENIDKFINAYVRALPNAEHRICELFLPVLDALAYIHTKGIIHMDIKPSNIMMEQGRNVRLMDLGIARMNGGNKFSSYGFIGTPEYSAPEQMLREQNGANVQINATTDIYELGITFYELLAGNNPMSCPSEAETLTKQMKQQLPSSERIPHKLMQVIWKATETLGAQK